MINNILFHILIKNLIISKLNTNIFVKKQNFSCSISLEKFSLNLYFFNKITLLFNYNYLNYFFLKNYENKIFYFNYLINNFKYNYYLNKNIIFLKNFNKIFLSKKINKKLFFLKNNIFIDQNIFLNEIKKKLFNFNINFSIRLKLKHLKIEDNCFIFKKIFILKHKKNFCLNFLINNVYINSCTKSYFFLKSIFFNNINLNKIKKNMNFIESNYYNKLNYYAYINNYENIDKNDFDISSILSDYNFIFRSSKHKIFFPLKSFYSSFDFKINKLNFIIYKNRINLFYFYNLYKLQYKKIISFKNVKNEKKNENSIFLNLTHNMKYILKTFFFINDFYDDSKNNFYSNINLFRYNMVSNKLIVNSLTSLESSEYFFSNLKTSDIKNNKKKLKIFNNYYPIFLLGDKGSNKLFSKFKLSLNISHLNYFQTVGLNFLECHFKKFFFLKISNNFFKPYLYSDYLFSIYEEYKYYKPKYMKNYFIYDFLELLWYSFLYKDLKFISNWISNFMETINFKNHKKFLQFFQNLVKKHSSVFLTILKIDGFFFDIRGKVGVSGSSKKRHITFKIGKLNKSNKLSKIAFNQNLVRTYSGVLGLTYIISY